VLKVLKSTVMDSTVQTIIAVTDTEPNSTDIEATATLIGDQVTASTIVADVIVDGLSKKGRKRLLKQEVRKDAKKLRKDKDKEKKKGSNSRSFRISSVSEVTDADGVRISRKERKEASKAEFSSLCLQNFTVIIDLNWEEHHTEKALKSLKQQVMYCYGFNKRHTLPSLIHLTGLGPLLSEQLVAQNHADNWLGMKMTRSEYISLTNDYSLSYDDDVKAGLKKQLVYLTSDAEETIESLDKNCAYIIGGVVDRNRLKGITYKKATAQGIRTAKLPIKENYALSATHILTVNHVFEILLNYGSTGGWKKAMEAVLPQRKHAKAKGGEGEGEGADDEDGHVDLQEAEEEEGTDDHTAPESDPICDEEKLNDVITAGSSSRSIKPSDCSAHIAP
jgi:tRNA (guanine9-N1)-methyltransferase